MDDLAKIMDWLYSSGQSEDLMLRVGIWDSDETPYTMYAIIVDRDGSVQYGESSYGSVTIEAAIGCLLVELAEAQP